MNIREWTLPVYTILTQLSTGALLFIWIIRSLQTRQLGPECVDRSLKVPVMILMTTIIMAIGFAHLHLSRPLLSFTALRNVGTSWLSRELLFNLLYILLVFLLVFFLWFVKERYAFKTVLGWLAILAGLATEYCMSNIYLLPTQPAWNSWLTPLSFLVTALLLGVVTVPVLFTMDLIFQKSQKSGDSYVHTQLMESSINWLSILAISLSVLMAALIYFQTAFLYLSTPAAQVSLTLLMDIYQPLFILRLLTLFAGVGWLAVTSLQFHKKNILLESILQHGFIACLLVMVSEILGRFLFFAIHVKVGI
jgi:anaerobic dimethyl sulfoxide reductase subunit C (anchor subunit)